MIPVPHDVMNDYVIMLRSREIPPTRFEHYKKWLRYFYDFYAKYLETDDKPEKVKLFLDKLRSKGQTTYQCQQAAHAVSLYFEMQSQGSQPEALGKQAALQQKPVITAESSPSVPSEQVPPADQTKIGEHARQLVRCGWAGSDPLYCRYHDNEWGVPVHDDRLLFEFLLLEGAQAGLSWITILKKREAYRLAFSNFEPSLVVGFDEGKVTELMSDAGIVRNRLKINSAITNAQAFLKVQDEFGSFDSYIWGFTGGMTIQNRWSVLKDVPVNTKESDAMSRDLKMRGFKFIGSTICYAFMQAIGMVNDHTVDCFRRL